jgi:hypothetical protein
MKACDGSGAPEGQHGVDVQYPKLSSEKVRALFACWRRLPHEEIKRRIQCLCRAAVRTHFSQAQWKEIDRMRRYVNEQKESRCVKETSTPSID